MADSELTRKIRERILISDFIRKDVRLTRKGNTWLGLCPFHKEKTPSFNVRDERGFYHCFGCGEHGDVFDYLMRYKKMEFPEALKMLAQTAGVALPRDSRGTQENDRHEQLYKVLEAACKWFEGQMSPKVREYLDKRGVTGETSKRFRLGYAPPSGLQQALKKQGFADELLSEAGLTGRNERGYYDWFRDRVIFPIMDRQGRVCGFGGRTLGDAEPKYLNSPQTPVFHKKNILYGLHESHRHLRDAAIVVEGYLDVISMIQAGYKGVVAPLGTALTVEQLEYLWRANTQPLLCFDGDKAGLKAARRSVEMSLPLLRPGRTVRCAVLPAGQDPDSLIREKRFDALKQAFDNPLTVLDVLFDAQRESLPAQPRAEDKALFRQNLTEQLDAVTDKDLKYLLRQEVFERCRTEFAAAGKNSRTPPLRAVAPMSAGGGYQVNRSRQKSLLEKILMAIAVSHPYILEESGEMLMQTEFEDPAMERLRMICVDAAMEHAESLLDRCIRENMQDIVHGLQNDAIITGFAPVIKVTSAPDQVRAFWQEIWQRLYIIPSVTKEREQLLRQCRDDAQPQHWQRLKHLKLTKI